MINTQFYSLILNSLDFHNAAEIGLLKILTDENDVGNYFLQVQFLIIVIISEMIILQYV